MAAAMITNRYPGKCRSCGRRVGERQGFAAKNGGGRWYVLCKSRACAESTGIDSKAVEAKAAAGSGPRTLTMEGRRLCVRMPKDFAAIPLLRSLPGARFDWDEKAWYCSGALEDRERILEIADQLKLDVEGPLRNTFDPFVEAAVKRVGSEQLPFKAYGYQVEGVRWLAGRTKALLGDDMGLGKTMQVLLALPEDARAVIVCKSSLKFVWRDEQALWRPDLKTTILYGRNAWKTPEPGEIVVVNYEILPAFLKPPAKKKGEPRKAAPVPEDVKAGLKGVTLVCDEATTVKNFRAACSQKVGTLAELASRCWLLSGTPLDNKPPDLYGLLESGGMAYQTFGGWGRFVKLFSGFKNNWGGYEWGEPAAEVPEMLRRVMLRRRKVDVLKDLPPKRFQTLTVNGEDKALKAEMDALWAEWGDALESDVLPPFEEFSTVRQKLAAGRVKHVLELAAQYEEAETPLVVFSAHKAPVEALGERDGWTTITGDITDKEERGRRVKAFQSGELKGIALTIGAGGMGLTLTKASTMLFVDLDWRPMQNAQAEDRCVRIGQAADSVHIIRMVQDHPLDRHVLRLLAEKTATINKAVEDRYEYKAPEAPAESAEPMFEEETAEELAERLAAMSEAEREAEREAHGRKVEGIVERHRGRGFSKRAEDLTDEVREQIVGAYGFMLGRCDGAVKEDGVGFNKPDAAIAHMVGAFNLGSDADLLALWGLLAKYHKQCRGSFPALYERK